MGNYSVIGKKTPRIDGSAKVTGEAKYAGDMELAQMLIGKILRSPHPHARILNIDVSKARRLSGVKAVLTGHDTAKIKFGSFDSVPQTANEYFLTWDKARYIGDELACVAATDEDIAEEALDLIEVEYEILPGIFDPEEAMKPGMPLIHEESENNISVRIFWDLGEVDKALKEAYYVREDRFVTQSVLHAPMEPHTALAMVDTAGKLTLWTSTQVPYYIQRWLARTLPMSLDQIRVIKPHMGGGFGGKWEVYPIDFCASLLAKTTGKPVKIAYTREEEFLATHRRHPEILYLKTGVKKDGTITVREARVILDGGAYNSCGHVTAYLSGGFQTVPYRIPNFRYEGIRVFTNKAPCGAMRGHGGVQPQYSADVQLDMIAEELGIDPVEIRLKNSLQPGDTTLTNYKILTCGLPECLDKGTERSHFKEKRGKMPEGLGIGIGCNGFVSGTSFRIHASPDAYSTAIIKLAEGGKVLLTTGASDIGQGAETVLAMIAAEELGVALEDIKVVSADTELAPLDAGSYSSRVTLFAGTAVRNAASEVKKQLLKFAADRLEANVEDLEVRDKRIFVRGSPEKGMSVAEAVSVAQWAQDGKPLTAVGTYVPPEAYMAEDKAMDPLHGPASPAYSFGAHFAEIKVDRETGQITVLNFTATHDCGFAINPMAVEGQLEGSVNMGLGYTLREEIIMDKGLPLNPRLLDYKVQTSLDMPPMGSIIVETKDPQGPFGAKEASEGTLNPTPASVANALYDALGIRMKSLPITPEKVLEAMESSR